METLELIKYVHANDSRSLLGPEGVVRFLRPAMSLPGDWNPNELKHYEAKPLALGQRLESIVPPNPNVDHVTLTCMSLSIYTLAVINAAVSKKTSLCGEKLPDSNDYLMREQLFECAVDWFIHPLFYYRESGTDGLWYALDSINTQKHRLVSARLVTELPRGARTSKCLTSHERIAEAAIAGSHGTYHMLHSNCQNFVVTLCEQLKLDGILSNINFWLKRLHIQRQSRRRRYEQTPAYKADGAFVHEC